MFILGLVGAMFIVGNQEFFATAEQQIENGYSWEYIGKTKPSGVPALTVLDSQNNEAIYFKLAK
jgi:hypothetical protein